MSWQLHELERRGGSGFWLQFEEPKGFRLDRIRFGDLLEGCTARIGHELMGVAAAGSQMRQQRGEAVHWHPISGLISLLFGFRRCRSFGGLDWVPLPPILFQ